VIFSVRNLQLSVGKFQLFATPCKFFFTHGTVEIVSRICSTRGLMRNEVVTANDTLPPPTMLRAPSSPLNAGVSWETASGINKTEARRICQASIVESAAYKLAKNYTAAALETITVTCMLDLQVSVNTVRNVGGKTTCLSR